MKLSLGWSAEIFWLPIRRLLGLGFWSLVVPTGLYSLWLYRGHSLLPLQIGLMVISFLGLVVVNSETIAVLHRSRPETDLSTRGLLQRLLSRQTTVTDPIPVAIAPQRLPFVSVIVVAYLPNEQDIILETLEHWLTQVEKPVRGWEVILAYNTPTRLPVEAQLEELSRRFPELILLPVQGSTSKAENLNAALEQVRGDMTCIFDADHLPARDCLMRSWAWLQHGQYDGVQGRNIIRNYDDNWLTTLIAVEFECIYGVSHYGRSLLTDTALFGGSNGYWRTSVIRSIGFCEARLTEDIDATLRALLQGYRIVHDPAILTTELAPDHLKSLWLQRQRWSQGWIEVAAQYLRRVWRSPHLDPFQKVGWLIMLLYSQYFHPIIWQAIPIALSLALMDPERSFTLTMQVWNWSMMGLLTLSIVIQVWVAIRPRFSDASLSLTHGVIYCLLSPFYFWFRSLVALVAFYNHLSGSRTWHITRRSRRKATLALQTQGKKPYPARSR